MDAYTKLYKTYEKYMNEADKMIREAYKAKRHPEYMDVDLLRGKLLAISEVTTNDFMSKKAKEKESELDCMLYDL